jgi:hypothetical protein
MSDEDNVVHIEGGKRGRKRKPAADEAEYIPPIVERFKLLKAAIDRDATSRWPHMEHTYKAFTPDNGLTRLLLKVEDGSDICSIATVKSFTDDVLNHVVPWRSPWWQWDYDQTLKFAKYFLATCQLVEEPKPYRWLGEDGLCFHRLEWELKACPHPTWTALLKRMSNSQAFIHFIGSLFVDDSDQQQYLWMSGEGRDGKGSINRLLRRIFGKAYFSGEPPMGERTKFWGHYALPGKRLVVFPDCEATGFVKTGFFKTLTGNDPIALEIKGGTIYVYQHHAKFMFYSNRRPQISSEKSDLRRLILCELSGEELIPGTAEEFEGKLREEAGGFIHFCLLSYLAAYPDRAAIVSDEVGEALVAQLISSNEEEFEVVFNQAFFKTPAGSVKPEDMQMVIKAHFLDRKRGEEFTRWLEREHKVKKRQIRDGAKRFWLYSGLALKNARF